MNFSLTAPFAPAGDQPQAIASLIENVRKNMRYQTLLGVTGSGKTFTMAQVIAATNRPALVLSHNKTLAAQLYEEFKEFFPTNAVHYFVSYYDYYQPEAYIPNTDTYIEKDAKINAFIDELRHASTQAVLTRRDCIVVASVSAIYGIGAPEEYLRFALTIKKGEKLSPKKFSARLAAMQYNRNDIERVPGTWSKKGAAYSIVTPSGDSILRVHFFGDEIEEILSSPATPDTRFEKRDEITLFPAKHFMTPEKSLVRGIKLIEEELTARVAELKKQKKIFEAERLKKRTRYDLRMLKETGYTNGIENYSRHLSGRKKGEPPATLLDYMPKDFITFIDESHMTLPQIRGMAHGDRARKQTLVDHGFRLPSALDNRPLTFTEFEARVGQVMYVSATPSPYELAHGAIVEQLVRPTGLLEPEIEIRPTEHQIAETEKEIKQRVARGERALILALTKRMAEDIAEYLTTKKLRVAWLHSEIKTIERHDIIKNLRRGTVDALVGVNLLREGIDLPEVSLIAILDADKEGFLRNATTLIQTIGRASRHQNGHVILFADTITDSMKTAIRETRRRRKYQEAFNRAHGITPKPLVKEIRSSLFANIKKVTKESIFAEFQKEKKSLSELKREVEAETLEAAADLNFERAAELRDILKTL